MRRPGGTFGIPATLAATTLAALIVGLLDDGLMDAIAWIALTLPLAALVPALFGLRGAGRSARRERL